MYFPTYSFQIETWKSFPLYAFSTARWSVAETTKSQSQPSTNSTDLNHSTTIHLQFPTQGISTYAIQSCC